MAEEQKSKTPAVEKKEEAVEKTRGPVQASPLQGKRSAVPVLPKDLKLTAAMSDADVKKAFADAKLELTSFRLRTDEQGKYWSLIISGHKLQVRV